MPIQEWSEQILLADLQDDPLLSDDINALIETVEARPEFNVVMNFSQVSYVNSSNISKLLKLRKLVTINNHRKLKLCGISTQVWGVFLVTGLDKVFDFADDVTSGLAGMQLDAG
ncbi:MAG: STAS domain-containing protein [Phycisphaerae bacterium]|nr:STAS domain-containing protein [Phycisphaerae bacterium]